MAGYKLANSEDLRTSLGRADPKEPIRATPKVPYGRVLVCVDRGASARSGPRWLFKTAKRIV